MKNAATPNGARTENTAHGPLDDGPEFQIVYRDERWWFIRPSGQWVGPYRTRQDAERKAS